MLARNISYKNSPKDKRKYYAFMSSNGDRLNIPNFKIPIFNNVLRNIFTKLLEGKNYFFAQI